MEELPKEKKKLTSIAHLIFLLTQMFDRHLCWQQLKFSGMLETVKYDFFVIFDFLTMTSESKAIFTLISISK